MKKINRAKNISKILLVESVFVLFGIFFILTSAISAHKDGVSAQSLHCEYVENPLAINTSTPRLSWILQSEEQGQKQTAYQILVSSSENLLEEGKSDLWDSGRVLSDETVGIVYSGAKLCSGQKCWWKVRVWDKNGKVSPWSETASWRIGLLSPDDWQAKWIKPLPTGDGQTRHFGYKSLPAKSVTDTKWIQIDLGEIQSIDAVRLWGAWPIIDHIVRDLPPGEGFPIRFKIEASNDAGFTNPRMLVDSLSSDVTNPGIKPMLISFFPVKARYVKLSAIKLSGDWKKIWDKENEAFGVKNKIAPDPALLKLSLAEMEVLCNGENVAYGKPVDATDSYENKEKGWSIEYLTDGRTEAFNGEESRVQPVSLLCKEFKINKPVRSAILYAASIGCHEVHVNGKQAGNEELATGISFNKNRGIYQSYDVSKMLHIGNNAIGAMVADGWIGARPHFDWFCGGRRFRYGERLFLAQLEIEYKDGTSETISTDKNWLCYTDGPFQKTSIYDGVLYDARKEVPGWDMPGPLQHDNWDSGLPEQDVSSKLYKLDAQTMPPVRVVKELKPVDKKNPKPGKFVFDFGQDIAGFCRITVDAQKGDSISLRYASSQNTDGNINTGGLHGAYNNNDSYILNKAGVQTFQAKFTYHGFRYVEVSGVSSVDAIQNINALSLGSDLQKASSFFCSDTTLVSICKLVENAYYSNMMGMNVDVTDRDERAVWLGDCFTTQVQSQSYMFDFAAYGANENREIQSFIGPNGHPGYTLRLTPTPETPACAGWSDASITTPYYLWLNYADQYTLEASYPSAARFMDAIAEANPEFIPRKKYFAKFGDWSSTAKAPDTLFAATCWAYSADLVSQMAKALGKKEDARKYAAMSRNICSAIAREFITPDGIVAGKGQSSYAMVLEMAKLSEDHPLYKSVLDNLLQSVYDNDNHFTTGTFTTIFLLKFLAQNGYQDLASQMVLQPDSMSFNAFLGKGATAMWEFFKGGGHNHLGLNSVYEWIFGYVGGIRPDPDYPGFKRFFIAPKMGGEIDWAKSSYESVRGKIKCSWKVERNIFLLDIAVPPGTDATVFIPAKNADSVMGNGIPVDNIREINFLRIEDENAVYLVHSGEYRFTSKI